MTNEEIHALIIDLIDNYVDEEDRQLVLDWVMARNLTYNYMADHGLITPDDWASMGLKIAK